MKGRKEDVSMLVYEFSERAEVIVANVFTSFAGGVMHASERIRQVAAFRPVLWICFDWLAYPLVLVPFGEFILR